MKFIFYIITLPFSFTYWFGRRIYLVLMLPMNWAFDFLNQYLPVHEAISSSKAKVRQTAHTTLFSVTSLLLK